MDYSRLLSWIRSAPQLEGEPINWNYLPSYAGWSLSVPKAETKTDILGNRRSTLQLKITRRLSIQSNLDRLAVVETLEDLAAWLMENPPPDTRLRVASVPEFTSRNASSTEDISITLILLEE